MVDFLYRHSLTILLASLWLGLTSLSALLSNDSERWLENVVRDLAGNSYGAFILLFLGRILWLHEKGRSDKPPSEPPDV